MTIRLVEGNLDNPHVRDLLQLHLDEMRQNSPPGSVFALDIEALKAPAVTFFTAWDGDELMGCGALKQLDTTHGEVKSMRTHAAFQGKGVAANVLSHIIGVCRDRGYTRLSLETGSADHFATAQRLYQRFGFVSCVAFADYPENSFSRFYTLTL